MANLAAHNCYWVLSRVKLHMAQLPSSESKITITTWPTGSDTLFFVRNFNFSDENGLPIGGATTSWLILDKDKHRPLRHQMLSHIEYPTKESSFNEQATKLSPPLNAIYSHTQTARYSNIDLNGHVNNATYVDWMFDTLTADETPSTPFTFTINFNKETRWGQTVEVFKSHHHNGSICFEVRNNGQPAAIALLEP